MILWDPEILWWKQILLWGMFFMTLSLPKISDRQKHKDLKKICDLLWAECIKYRADWKSEYSGRKGILHAHHLMGKSCYALRYSLENGICLTAGEHKFIAHHAGRQEQFRKRVKEIRGDDIFEKLYKIKWMTTTPPDLLIIRLYLEKELNKLKEVLDEIHSD